MAVATDRRYRTVAARGEAVGPGAPRLWGTRSRASRLGRVGSTRPTRAMKTPTQATSGHSSQRTVWNTADSVIMAYPTTVVAHRPGLVTAARRVAKSDASMAAVEPRKNTRVHSRWV